MGVSATFCSFGLTDNFLKSWTKCQHSFHLHLCTPGWVCTFAHTAGFAPLCTQCSVLTLPKHRTLPCCGSTHRGKAHQISYSCWAWVSCDLPWLCTLLTAILSADTQYQKPSLISREHLSSPAFYSWASAYTKSLPELLGSCSLSADSAAPVSGRADKGPPWSWKVSKHIQQSQLRVQ